MNACLKYIPNTITVMRILLIVPIIGYIWQNEYSIAFILIVIAGISDGVDGFLARYFHWQTPSGAILDPLADKLLLVSLFVVFGFKELLPVWLVVLVILRDVVIFSGAVAYHFVTHQLEMRPLMLSKISTALQIMLVILVALSLAYTNIPEWLFDVMIALVAVFTMISGIGYVVLWSRYTMQIKHINNTSEKRGL